MEYANETEEKEIVKQILFPRLFKRIKFLKRIP